MKESTPIKLDKETREWLKTIFIAQKSSIGFRWKLTAYVVAAATVISATFQVITYFCR